MNTNVFMNTAASPDTMCLDSLAVFRSLPKHCSLLLGHESWKLTRAAGEEEAPDRAPWRLCSDLGGGGKAGRKTSAPPEALRGGAVCCCWPGWSRFACGQLQGRSGAPGGAAAMGRTVTVATCALNQWALDFDGNLARILKSKWGHVRGKASAIT